MWKFIKIAALCVIFLMITSAALLQTPYVQRRLKAGIEKRVPGLSIGKVGGFLPIWLTLDDVAYTTPSMQAQFKSVHLTLAPHTLLVGKVSLIRLDIEEGSITTEPTPDEVLWPKLPFALAIQSLEIKQVKLNTIDEIHMTGEVEIEQDFSAHLTLTLSSVPNTIFRINAEGDHLTNEIDLQILARSPVSKLKEPLYELTFSCKTHLPTMALQGTLHGTLHPPMLPTPYHLLSDVSFENKKLELSSFAIKDETQILAVGAGSYDLENKKLSLEGKAQNKPYNLSAQFDLQQECCILVKNLALNYLGSRLTGEAGYQPSERSYSGHLDLSSPNLQELQDLVHSPLEGSLNAHIDFSDQKIDLKAMGENVRWKNFSSQELAFEGCWQKNRPLNFQGKLGDFAVLEPTYEVFPSVHFLFNGTLHDERLSMKGRMWGLGDEPFTIDGELPLLIDISPLDVKINKSAPLKLRVSGKGSIDPLLAYLENASLIASGKVDLDLGFQGTFNDPKLSGFANIFDSKVESLATGATYEKININMRADGRILQITDLSATDGQKGALTGNGQLIWDPESGYPFSLSVQTQNFALMATDPFSSFVDGTFTIEGSLKGIAIDGEATIISGEISIPNQMPINVPTIDVTYIHPLPSTSATPLKKKLLPIHWNLKVDIPKDLVIEGRELVSEWRGKLQITGEQNDLSYSGKLKLVQGRFKLLGKTFGLSAGQIRLEGIEPADITIDVKGDLELPKMTASINIKGPLSNLSYNFSSIPAMGANQILSWILFNADINELTPMQACSLANTMVSLSGKYTGPGRFERILQSVGIDVLNITDCDLDEADLTFLVGKYISQGTFVGINKSISGNTDSVTVQTRLYRDFFLEGNYGGSLNGLTPNGGKIVFKWYKTY